MTREILFRGKRIDNGEWVEGLLFKYCGEFCIALYSLEGDDYGLYPTCYAQVDPSTVGQFTGLCDKNGNKIFEGDIVNIHDTTGFDMTGVIEYNSCSFELYDAENDAFECLWYAPTVITILGNFHDNPELLEGGK